MKRMITLMIALALVFGAVANSSAADIKAKGSLKVETAWTDNLNWNDANADNVSEDDFVAQQRFRTQIDIVANENLSGVVYFEIDQTWGRSDAKAGSSSGGALGADGVNVETKRAYMDWTVPNTALSIRMGIQGLALPGEVAGSPILDDDVAAMVATYKFNDMFSMNAFWARPYDSVQTDAAGDGKADEIDLFGLIGGIKLDGMEFTPYAMYGAIGSDAADVKGLQSLVGSRLTAINSPLRGAFNATNWGSANPDALSTDLVYAYNGTDNMESSRAYWLGLGFKMDMFDPIVFKMDAVYGSVEGGDLSYDLTAFNATSGNTNGVNGTVVTNKLGQSDDDILDRAGWMIDAKLSYKMDMVTPGVIGWYASGEDDDITNGSERLPVISGAYSPTTFGFDGYSGFNLATGDLLGVSNDGKWAVGILLEDIKVIESLTSQLRVLYVEGTNDADVLNQIGYLGYTKASFLAANRGTFMTDQDHAWEVNFDHKYDIYENLAMVVEMGYVNMDLDEDAWGLGNTSTKYNDDAYKLGVVFQYSF